MSARDDILNRIRARTRPSSQMPRQWSGRLPDADLLTAFAERAAAANAIVRILDRRDELPGAIADFLRARNLPAIVHVPSGASPKMPMPLPFLETPPGADDVALTEAPFAIAETGTLVYPASESAPAAWHFRPGAEIAILQAENIVADLETALCGIGSLPHTVNLVTGPSRTGDIEQTLELGAHGPKALAIFVIRRPSHPKD